MARYLSKGARKPCRLYWFDKLTDRVDFVGALFDWFTSAKSRRMCTKAARLNDAETAVARDEGKSSLHPCKFFPGSKSGREGGAHAMMTTLRHTTRLCKPRSLLCKKLANNENDVSKSAASIDRQRQCWQHKSRTSRYFRQ